MAEVEGEVKKKKKRQKVRKVRRAVNPEKAKLRAVKKAARALAALEIYGTGAQEAALILARAK